MKRTVLVLLVIAAVSQAQLLKTFHMGAATPPQKGLAGNGITDIKADGAGTLWFGTGHGLSRTANDGESFETFGTAVGVGHGSVCGLWASGDTVIVATATDTLTKASEQTLSKGTGISISFDSGATWSHYGQPGTTPVQNLAYDIEVLQGTVWITCFGGGLMKSDDWCKTWTVVTPDSFIFDPGKRLNHRAFAVVAGDGDLYVGTAEGVNKSTDNGTTWVNYNHYNQSQAMSGNFITALGYQKTTSRRILWAATWKAEGTNEFYAVSKSENGGLSWQTLLKDEQAHNFAFDDSVVYVATDNGLFKSIDYGQTWYLFPAMRDQESSNRVYELETDSAYGQDGIVWAGTTDGLARSSNNGYSWKIYRAFVATGQAGEPRTYAYPNPFSPMRHNQLGGDGHVRIQYNTLADTHVTIKVFDYAMDLVTTVVDNQFRRGPSDYSDVWNGRNDYGDSVANGVYFYKVELDGDGVYWGKVMIVN